MVPPLIICVFMGTLALACVGSVVWQVSLLLAGVAWAEAQTQTELPELTGQK